MNFTAFQQNLRPCSLCSPMLRIAASTALAALVQEGPSLELLAHKNCRPALLPTQAKYVVLL
jgi:hypothetical protein